MNYTLLNKLFFFPKRFPLIVFSGGSHSEELALSCRTSKGCCSVIHTHFEGSGFEKNLAKKFLQINL